LSDWGLNELENCELKSSGNKITWKVCEAIEWFNLLTQIVKFISWKIIKSNQG